MKTAVCLSGQPRFLEICYDSIKSNLIDVNNADVFLHTWSYEDEPDQPYKFGGSGGWKKQRIEKDAHNKAIDMYKPLVSEVEKSFKVIFPGSGYHHSFQSFKSGIPKEALEAGMTLSQYSSKIFSDAYCMWYGIMKSNMLANQHALKSGFEYDFVVRVRFDVKVETKVEMSKFDKEFVYFCDLGQPQGLVSDWVNFGSQRNMAVFSSVCMNMFHAENFYLQSDLKDRYQYCSELIGSLNLQRHGIQAIPFSASVSLPRY